MTTTALTSGIGLEMVAELAAQLRVDNAGPHLPAHHPRRLRAAEILGAEGISAHLAVRDLPGSGSGQELLAWAGIDARHIAAAARRLADSHEDG